MARKLHPLDVRYKGPSTAFTGKPRRQRDAEPASVRTPWGESAAPPPPPDAHKPPPRPILGARPLPPPSASRSGPIRRLMIWAAAIVLIVLANGWLTRSFGVLSITPVPMQQLQINEPGLTL